MSSQVSNGKVTQSPIDNASLLVKGCESEECLCLYDRSGVDASDAVRLQRLRGVSSVQQIYIPKLTSLG